MPSWLLKCEDLLLNYEEISTKTKLLGFSSLMSFCLMAPVSGGEKAAATELKADPKSPTTLDERDPSFESLDQTRHKPNATYHNRDFKKGTVQSLEGMLKGLKKRSEENLAQIVKLNKKLDGLEAQEKEKISLGLEEVRSKQETYLDTLNKYSSGPYQTNLSAESLRAELKQIDTEVTNLTNLLGSWQKENKTSWE